MEKIQKEILKDRVINFLKNKKELAISSLGKELKIAHLRLTLEIIPELQKENKIELLNNGTSFTYVRLK